MDSNHRPLGYEPNELPLLHPATMSLARYQIVGRSLGTSSVVQSIAPPRASSSASCTSKRGFEVVA